MDNFITLLFFLMLVALVVMGYLLSNNDVKAYVAADMLTDDEEKADDVKAYIAADILTDDMKDY